MTEGISGEIKVQDTSADVMENLLFFLYHDFVDKTKISSDLLKIADKYLVQGLVDVCVEYLSSNFEFNNG